MIWLWASIIDASIRKVDINNQALNSYERDIGRERSSEVDATGPERVTGRRAEGQAVEPFTVDWLVRRTTGQ